jgi:hypothetical protein
MANLPEIFYPKGVSDRGTPYHPISLLFVLMYYMDLSLKIKKITIFMVSKLLLEPLRLVTYFLLMTAYYFAGLPRRKLMF